MAAESGSQPLSAEQPPFAGIPDPEAGLDDRAQAEVIHRAIAVIGDRSDAMRWLGTPVRALNYATPISLLHTAEGREAVISVLGRIEHGVL